MERGTRFELATACLEGTAGLSRGGNAAVTGLHADTKSVYSLADGFYLALRASGRSPNTETTYRESVSSLERFAAEMGMPPPVAMSAEHLRHYFLSLYDKGNRPGTVSVRYRALSSFYKWLVTEGELTDSPLKRVPPPRPEQRILSHYTPDAIERLLSAIAASKDFLSARDAALVLLLFDTGLRAQEVCGLTRADFDLKRLVLKAYGKGNKERLVGVGYATAQAVERYSRRRTDSAPWLFVSRARTQLSYGGLTLMLRKRFRAAGLDYKGAHGFRRGFAMAYLDSGGSPEDLRVLAGWDSPQMLRRYTKATEGERALKGHRAHSPADALATGRRR
jgi:site-specific recombinase XerD